MNKKIYLISSLVTVTLFTLGAGCTGSTAPVTNKNKTVAPVVNTNVDVAVEIFNAKASDKEIKNDVNGQWASSATASTAYGTDSWAAKQATGKPNVDVYGDNVNAWAPAEQNKGVETLELSYAQAVYVSGVRIHENYGSGAVTKVELKGEDGKNLPMEGKYYTVWEGVDTTKGLSYFQIPVDTTVYKVDGVKVTFDTTKVPTEWAEVDAVQLVGQ